MTTANGLIEPDGTTIPLVSTRSTYSVEELYNRYFNFVYAICLKMLTNAADAEDMVQDVFLQVQRRLESYSGRAGISSWLYRVTVNQVLMKMRKPAYRAERTTESGDMPEMVMPHTEKPGKMPIIDHILLADAIAKLPPGYCKIFMLHDVLGYEHNEIATMLGINIGTSKSQLHKAHMRLRTFLREQKRLACKNKEIYSNN